MECISTITDKLQPNFFSIFGFLLNILLIPRLGITIAAHADLFTESNLACTPNSTSDIASESFEQRCNEILNSRWPPYIHWYFQIGLTLGVLISFYFPSWWIVEHRKPSDGLEVNYERYEQMKNYICWGYLAQTSLRTVSECSFTVSQVAIYGFRVPSHFICKIDNNEIPCNVLMVTEKLALLGAMFGISILVICLHLADLYSTIKKFKRDRKLSTLPVLCDVGRYSFSQETLLGPVENVLKCENYRKLENRLEDKHLVVLIGPPGSGKTQIARLYAEKFLKENKGSMCFYFKATSPDDILVDGKQAITQNKLNIDVLNKESDGGNSTFIENAAKRQLYAIAEKLKNDKQKTVFIFDRATSKTTSIIKEVFPDNSYFKVVITSNDQHIESAFKDLISEVHGYSDKDIELLSELYPYDQFNLEDLKILAKKLDFSPLGIHAGCQYIIDSEDFTIQNFLTRLEEGKEPMSEREEEIVRLNGYDKTQIGIFKDSYKKICEKYTDIKDLLNLVATFSPDPIHFDILDWIIRASCLETTPQSESDRKFIRNKLIEVIKKYHLGTVAKDQATGGNQKILTLHNIPRFAITTNWSIKERMKYILEMLLILDDQVDKDTRHTSNLTFFLKLIPHVKHALKTDLTGLSRDENAVGMFGVQILQIGLQDKLHHMYTQTGLISYFRESTSKAKELFYSLIMKNPSHVAEQSLNEEVKRSLMNTEEKCTVNNAFIKAKACLIFNKLKLFDVPKEPVDFLTELVCTRRLNEGDIRLLQTKVKNNKDPAEFIPNAHLTEKIYNDLVQQEAAIPLEKMRRIFLLEFLVAILYTHGRMYFYQEQKLDADEVYEHDLHLAYELSRIINKEYEVKITVFLLAERNGFLYMDLDSQTKARVKNAKHRYEALLADEGEYYEKGLLKIATKGDLYHKTICRKQLVNYFTIAVKMESDSKKAKELYDEGCDEARRLLDAIKNKGFHNEAEAYVKVGELKMTESYTQTQTELCATDDVDSKLLENNTGYVDEAINNFNDAIEIEEAKKTSHQRPDLMVDAYYGLVRAYLERNKPKDLAKAKTYAEKAIKICEEKRTRMNIKQKLESKLNQMKPPQALDSET